MVAMLEEPTAPMQAPEEREANATHVKMLAAQRQVAQAVVGGGGTWTISISGGRL